MSKYKLIAICGKSASGKDTLLQGMAEIMGDKANTLISHTTRPPREGEVNGVNYHFITEDEFLHKIWHNEMLETAKYRNWWYGTAIDALAEDKINIGVFNRKGLESLKNYKGDLDIYVVYMMASDKMRLLRSLNREEEPDVAEIVRRYQADEEEWNGYVGANFYLENSGQGIGHERMVAVTALILGDAAQYWAKETNS